MPNVKTVCIAATLAVAAHAPQASAQCFYAPEYTNGPAGAYHNGPGTGSAASNPHCWQYGHDSLKGTVQNNDAVDGRRQRGRAIRVID